MDLVDQKYDTEGMAEWPGCIQISGASLISEKNAGGDPMARVAIICRCLHTRGWWVLMAMNEAFDGLSARTSTHWLVARITRRCPLTCLLIGAGFSQSLSEAVSQDTSPRLFCLVPPCELVWVSSQTAAGIPEKIPQDNKAEVLAF